ncbi:MAG: hypothetical protein Q8T03_12000 [Bacteroidota bacterium]|nr:hypothetical protein [Bacteroidota bacterium]
MDTVPECDELLKMFHTVYLSDKHTIQLKKDISTLTGIVNKLPNNYYSLKKGSFGVADSMAVEVNKDNQIIGITAAYNYEPEFSNDTIYIHEQRKYNGMLCKNGKEYFYTGKDTSFKVCKWDAGNIAFELMETIIKGKRQTYSVIFDKELYYQKLKPIDISGKDVSIELENRRGWAGLK